MFIPNYGSDSDWVQNVLAAGTASLKIDGNDVELMSPKLVSKEATWQLLPDTTKPPSGYMRITEYLQVGSG